MDTQEKNEQKDLNFNAAEQQHLQFIQDVITRLNSNSFSMKGWMVAIVSALVALYVDKGNIWLLIVSIVPILLFWFLDTYYLWMERKYRSLYNDTIKKQNDLYDMNASCYPINFVGTLFSKTIFPLYCIVLAFIVIIVLLMKFTA